jgi:serine/threonine-protein kinase
MAHLLASDPDWSALPPDTPPPIRRLLARCLTKDRKQRLHDIADARIEIDEAVAPRLPGKWSVAAVAQSNPWARRALWASAGLIGGLAIGVAVWNRPMPMPAVTHAQITVAPAAELNAGGVNPVVLPAGGSRTALAWSPDGRTLAFIGLTDGVRQVYLRDLASEAARPLAGTEGAGALAFSPDGSEIAFAADRVLRRVKIAGGPAAKICDTGDVNGLSWGATRIVFSEGSLWSIDLSPGGGKREPVTTPLELVRHASPFILPGGTALLYTEYQKQWTSGDERVMVMGLNPGARPRVLLAEGADARYLSSGHLAFMRQGTLFVVPFDVKTLELRGEPVAVVKDVAQAAVAWDSTDLTLAGQFAISQQGVLAYASSPLAAYPDRELVSVDRKGRIESIGAPPKAYRNHVELSPDGSRLGVAIQTPRDLQLFSYDLTRHNLSRLAESLRGELVLGAWSGDDRLAVGVVDAGKITTVVLRPDAAAPAVSVANSTGFWASSWSPDGRLAGMMAGDVWIYSNPGVTNPMALMKTPTEEFQPAWSPDGRWIAYSSGATGRSEVYLRPYPGPGEAILVSVGGGGSPAWNPDGRELFYIEPATPGQPQDRMMAVAFAPPGRAGKPDALFSFTSGTVFLGTTVFTPYAVAPGGRGFYCVKQLPKSLPPVTEVHVILGWFDDLKVKVPATR